MKKRKMLTLCVSLLAGMLITGCAAQPVLIARTYINESGELIVEYTNGSSENLGNLKGEKGETGDSGAQGPKGQTGDSGSKGAQGDTGAKGSQGDTGAKGQTGDTGAQGQTGDTGSQGPKGQTGETGLPGNPGSDGVVPHIGENGNWWIGNQDTNIKAQGEQGQTGEAGADGVVPHIGENGNWWIGNQDTNISAKGATGNAGAAGANGLVPYIGENGNWWIGETDTDVQAVGDKGENGQAGLTPFIGEDGNWWIGTVNTGVKAAGTVGTDGTAGVGVDHVVTSYEYDSASGKEYFVFTIYYTDESVDVKKVEVPKRVRSIQYIGLANYQLVESGSDPVLKLKVIYDDKSTKDVEITEDMYIIEEGFVKPNFKQRGTYNAKICYKGLVTTFSVKVIDPEYITHVSYVSETEYDVVLDGDIPELFLEVTYDGGVIEQVEITDGMYVIEDNFVKPNFEVVGTYTSKVDFCGTEVTFTIKINEGRPAELLVANKEFIQGCYYFDGTLHDGSVQNEEYFGKLKTHEQFIEPQKVRVVVEDNDNDVSNYAYKVAYSAYDASGNILNANDFRNAVFDMQDGVKELYLRKLYPTAAKFRVDVMIHNGDRNFVDIPLTAKIKIYSLQDIHKYEGKKIDILGDSITQQGKYFSTLKTLTGASTIYNNGVSGDKIVSFASRIKNLHDDADLIIVFGGTNDFWHKSVSIGTITDTSATFYGGLNSIYNGLMANFSDKDILFVFPPRQTFSNQADSPGFGYGSLGDFRLAMQTFCAAKGLDFYDLDTIPGNAQGNKWNPAPGVYTSDGVHLNETGGAMVGEGIFEHLVERKLTK